MSMYEAIKDVSLQFSYKPEIQNKEKLVQPTWYIIAGMGGSHLAADLLPLVNPKLSLMVHQNYGLPRVSDEIFSKCLVIANSYSGNTEEVLDSYEKAKEKNLPLAVISIGGELIERAKADGIPYIQLPDVGIQPRSALGYNLKALLALMGQEDSIQELEQTSLLTEELEEEGKQLAYKITNHIPVIYSSEENKAIAYNWKIKFNETGKIPAFYNVLPELNHNEMTGYDVQEETKALSEKFCFIFLTDKNDHPRIQKRMETLKKLYEDRSLPVMEISLKGKNVFDKIFSSLAVADFAAYYTAENYGVESEAVPMVEEFKKLI